MVPDDGYEVMREVASVEGSRIAFPLADDLVVMVRAAGEILFVGRSGTPRPTHVIDGTICYGTSVDFTKSSLQKMCGCSSVAGMAGDTHGAVYVFSSELGSMQMMLPATGSKVCFIGLCRIAADADIIVSVCESGLIRVRDEKKCEDFTHIHGGGVVSCALSGTFLFICRELGKPTLVISLDTEAVRLPRIATRTSLNFCVASSNGSKIFGVSHGGTLHSVNLESFPKLSLSVHQAAGDQIRAAVQGIASTSHVLTELKKKNAEANACIMEMKSALDLIAAKNGLKASPSIHVDESGQVDIRVKLHNATDVVVSSNWFFVLRFGKSHSFVSSLPRGISPNGTTTIRFNAIPMDQYGPIASRLYLLHRSNLPRVDGAPHFSNQRDLSMELASWMVFPWDICYRQERSRRCFLYQPPKPCPLIHGNTGDSSSAKRFRLVVPSESCMDVVEGFSAESVFNNSMELSVKAVGNKHLEVSINCSNRIEAIGVRLALLKLVLSRSGRKAFDVSSSKSNTLNTIIQKLDEIVTFEDLWNIYSQSRDIMYVIK